MVKKVGKRVAEATESKSKKKSDSSRPVMVKVKKLTENDIEGVIDKIITRNTKDKPAVKAKYRPPKKVRQVVNDVVRPVAEDKKLAKLNKKAAELRMESKKKAADLKLEAEERAARVRMEAEELAAQIKMEADEKAAELKMRANEKAARLTLGINRKAVKRELKETIKQAKREAAEKLGKATVKRAHLKKSAKRPLMSHSKKPHYKKVIRNTLVGSFVSLVLLIVGGVIYVWYTGLNVGSASAEVAPVVAKTQTEYQPSQRAANATLGVAIQYISSPILPGSTASVDVRTGPDAVCGISVKYKEVASTDAGLVTKTADKYGMVNWNWAVGQYTPTGKWPVTVTCTLNGKSAVVIGDLQVVAAVD